MKNFMLVVAALVIVSTVALAGNGVSGPFVVTSSVAVTPITLTPGTADLANVRSGQVYTVVPDGTLTGVVQVTPNDGTNPVWTSTETVIVGDPLAAVLVTHYLPSKLYGTLNGPPIGFSTNSTSAIYGPAGAETNYFNPAVPTVMYIDAAAAGVAISYGGIWSVPVDAVPDVFTGNGLIVVEYTGVQ